MSEPSDKEKSFVGFLETLAEGRDRAAVAALRRGLGKEPGEAPEMFPYIVPWTQGAWPVQEKAYYLVASLFAWHQGSWHGEANKAELTNLAASLARLAAAEPAGRQGAERRLVALLNSHQDDLGNHLRHTVGLLKSKEVPVDWAQLLHDIQGWAWESRSVQLAWARAFWGSAAAETDTSNIDTSSPAREDEE